MKKVALMVVFVLLVCAAVAPVLANEMKKNTHEMTAVFVSADAKAKMITIKDESGEQKTVPMMGSAIKEVEHLKGGETIVVTCQDNEKGEHQGVSMIKTAMAKK